MDIKNQNNKKLGELIKELSEKHLTIKNEIIHLIDKLDVVEKDYKEIINELKKRYTNS